MVRGRASLRVNVARGVRGDYSPCPFYGTIADNISFFLPSLQCQKFCNVTTYQGPSQVENLRLSRSNRPAQKNLGSSLSSALPGYR